MPRIPRQLIKGPNRCYHIISRTTGQEFALGDVEQEYLFRRIKWLSSIYFVKVFTICILSNHFHLLVQMQDGQNADDAEIEKRFRSYYGGKRSFPAGRSAFYRRKWSDLSEYVKEIKQGFSVWYNRMHNRKGYFWSERFKSVVVEDTEALTACMAYIDLNPVRANIVDRPEDYRYCGLGYSMQSGNPDAFLHLTIPGTPPGKDGGFSAYRDYVYRVGRLARGDGKGAIPDAVGQKQERTTGEVPLVQLFRYRSRYFTDSVVLGSRTFVKTIYARFQPHLQTARQKEKEPPSVPGMAGIFSLPRLRKAPHYP